MSEWNEQEANDAAVSAEQELSTALTEDTTLEPGVTYLMWWWDRWYMLSGHKRLGRILINMAKDEPERKE